MRIHLKIYQINLFLYGRSDINYMRLNSKNFGIMEKLLTFAKPLKQFFKYLLIILKFSK